jgi:hypothetical protein
LCRRQQENSTKKPRQLFIGQVLSVEELTFLLKAR